MKLCSECGGALPKGSRADREVCSVECKSVRSYRLRRHTWKTCAREECRKEFRTRSPSQAFCGRSCARRSSHRSGRGDRRQMIECGVCGRLTSNEKHCSRQCAAEARSVAALRGWLAGESSASYKDGRLTDAARSFLMQEAGHRCARCAWHEVNARVGLPVLHVHHLDGNLRNNFRSNLVVLCGNCLTLTESFAVSHPAEVARTLRTRSRATYDQVGR